MTLFSLLVLVMVVNLPKVHILGHSFDKHLSRDVSRGSNDKNGFKFSPPALSFSTFLRRELTNFALSILV